MRATEPYVLIVVEGSSDASVIARLFQDHGIQVAATYITHGKDELDARIPKYNQAAMHSPFFIVRDLDRDAPCASSLIEKLLTTARAPHLDLRVATPQIEAWLLGDSDGFARFFGVPKNAIPTAPETVRNAKHTLLDVLRRSRSRRIRDGMLPEANMTARIGPEYTGLVSEYAQLHWSWRRAAGVCSSLARCVRAIERVRDR